MDFNYYLKNFTGYGITVTIIDTGVNIRQDNVTHYRLEDENIIRCDTTLIKSTHGTMCAETILRVSPNIQIIDICVENKDSLLEHGIINALDFAFSNLKNRLVRQPYENIV